MKESFGPREKREADDSFYYRPDHSSGSSCMIDLGEQASSGRDSGGRDRMETIRETRGRHTSDVTQAARFFPSPEEVSALQKRMASGRDLATLT